LINEITVFSHDNRWLELIVNRKPGFRYSLN